MTDKVFPVYANAEKEVGASLERADGSLAEAKLYDMLHEQLPPDWSFIWGVQLGVHEYDFLVLVPGKGIVNVECKGYGYKHLPNHKFLWKNKKTGEDEIKDLMGQAAGAAKYYIEYLRRCLFGMGYQWGLMGYCVVFPLDEHENVVFSGLPIYRASDCDPRKKGLVKIIEESLDRAKDNLIRRFGVPNPALLSIENAERIWHFWMQNDDEVEHPRAIVKIDLQDFKSHMKNLLTVCQLDVMQWIEQASKRHILVEGTAGTGKSIIARYAAGKLEGENLYVCFNRLLAGYTKLILPENSHVKISHFHKLDELLLGTRLSLKKSKEEDDSSYWKRFDQEMLKAARNLPPTGRIKFDNIIVDEAQDLTEEQIRFLLRFCKTHGKFLLFSDLEQTLYPERLTADRLKKLLPDIEKRPLTVNLRNTKHVAAYCKGLMPTDSSVAKTEVILIGPEVVKKKISRENINKFLHDEVLSLYNPEDIAVLSPIHELLLYVTSACGTTFCGPDESNTKTEKNLVAWISGKNAWKSTTSSFKGLEAMAVVHLIPADYSYVDKLYVGGSRALHRLYVLEVE